MSTFNKFFLAVFVVFIGINLYSFQWQMGVLDEENTKYIFSIAAALLGILVVLIMHYWGKIGAKK